MQQKLNFQTTTSQEIKQHFEPKKIKIKIKNPVTYIWFSSPERSL
jgi:hypothetical protein